jgi:protein-L-isoaspartate O-methyltransferase
MIEIDRQAAQYEVSRVEITEGSGYPYAMVTRLSGRVVRVNGIPKTSPTSEAKIAQNILKKARQADRQGKDMVGYSS